MKRKIQRIACAASLVLLPTMAFADEGDGSGFFAGITMGYGIGFIKETTAEQGNTSVTIRTEAPSHINIGLQLGYNHYFFDFLGARLYLDYTYGFNHSDSKTTNTGQAAEIANMLASAHAVSINVDALVNLINTESFGLGYGTMSSTTKSNEQGVMTTITTPLGSGFILPINVGLSLTANGHHRFELGFKIPTIGLKYVAPVAQQGDPVTTTITRTLIGTFGYSYAF